jgi:hypothetical protein
MYKIQICISDTIPGTFILTTVQYLPNDGIFKLIPDIYCKYNMYRYYQIQPNIRFILIQPNIWFLQLFQDGLMYDPIKTFVSSDAT